jgi:hypothetical protein
MKNKDKNKEKLQFRNYAKAGQKPNTSHNDRRIKKRLAAGVEQPTGVHYGPKSLGEKLIDANLLTAVCVVTRNFRIANPQSSYLDLYMELNKTFPDWFPTDKKLYNGCNFSKQLHACPQWSAAYWAGAYKMDDILETKIHEGLYNDKFDNKELIKIYDIRTKQKDNQAMLATIEGTGQNDININLTIEDKEDEC